MRSLRLLPVAAALAAGLALPTAAASAATMHPTRELRTPAVKVTTTTGVVVHLQIDVDHDGSTFADVSLDNSKKGYSLFEGHDWMFRVTGSSLTYSNGSGVFASGTQFGPYGTMRLRFSKVGQTTTSCKNFDGAATSVTKVKVALRGTIRFAARTSSKLASEWGSVRKGTRTSLYHFGGAYGHYISSTNGTCRGSAPQSGTMPCFDGNAWSAPFDVMGTTMQFVDGDNLFGGSEIQAFRDKPLSSPSGADRNDIVVVAAPAPVLDPTGGTAGDGSLTVTTTDGSAATGSATLSATTPGEVQPTSKCSNGSTTGTQHETDYASADYTNDSTTPLVVHSGVGGDMTVADTTAASTTSPTSTTYPAQFEVYSTS